MKGNIWAVLRDSPWGSKEISHVLCNPKTKSRVQRSGPLGPNLGHLNQVHATYHTFFLFKIQLNILIPSRPTSKKLPIPFHRSISIILDYYQKVPVSIQLKTIFWEVHTHIDILQYNHITSSLAYLPFILKLFMCCYFTFDILYQSIRLTFKNTERKMNGR